jgi:anaerobic carbon-monoxide dehydrogenase iron sulfur subunit
MSTEPVHILNLQVDAAKCTACKACELSCSFAKEGAFSPHLSRIRVVQLHEQGMNVPIVCVNCADAPCIPACPTGAVFRDAKVPVVRIREEDCIGCGECVKACPFGAVDLNEEKGVAIMCDLCDGSPICVKHCMYGALTFKPPLSGAGVKRLARAQVTASQAKASQGVER